MKGRLWLCGVAVIGSVIFSNVTVPMVSAAPRTLAPVTFVQEWPVADGFWIPWILGKDKGFYADEGIDLNIVTPPTVADTMKYLGTGRADVAFTTVMDIVFAKEQGAPVVSIARYGKNNNWGIITPQGKKYTVAALKGKTIGAYNDAWTQAQLAMMLQHAGLSLNDVKIVIASDDTVPLLLQKRVDAITGLTNAEGTGMVTAGNMQTEFIPAIDNGVPNAPVLMLAGNQKWLEQNPQLAKAFMRATLKSIAYAVDHPDEAVNAFTKTYSKAYDEAFIRQQWHDTTPLLSPVNSAALAQNIDSWNALLTAVQAQKIVKETLPAEQYFTNKYLPE